MNIPVATLDDSRIPRMASMAKMESRIIVDRMTGLEFHRPWK